VLIKKDTSNSLLNCQVKKISVCLQVSYISVKKNVKVNFLVFIKKSVCFFTFSIELEKQKAEHDKKLRMAEEKKQNVKGVIGKLRREFRKLKARNAELPSYLQLPPSVSLV